MVTVILNSYNQARYLRTAVASVLNQTYDDLELLAIDNGSTDDSPEILSSYASDASAAIPTFRERTDYSTLQSRRQCGAR